MPEPEHYMILVDDDPDDLEMLSSSLQLLGVNTKCFDAADKALYYLQLVTDIGALPLFIVSDYNMPRIDGEQFLCTLKNNKYTSAIPVVIYSTSMSAKSRSKLLHLGADSCYTKPVLYAEFLTQVQVFKDRHARLSEQDEA